MATYVLVHGGWHGGWCWDRVKALLEPEHLVLTPTLSGLAERAGELTADLNLEDHAGEIVELLDSQDLTNVVLCGHSYGGAVITLVVDKIPQRIGSIVYLDAFVPRSGDSILTLTPAGPPRTKRRWICLLAEFFGLTGDDARYVEERMTPHPAKSITQVIHLTAAVPAELVPIRTYVFATGWMAPAHFKEVYDAAVADKSWRTEILEGSHDLMIDRPTEVARLLREASP